MRTYGYGTMRAAMGTAEVEEVDAVDEDHEVEVLEVDDSIITM